ncbi:hypothetical protein [Chromatium okenii]|uniref:hypothetical protein n=1 Tax=Chromatium okenii TaxID=61644 RepID=UPI0026EBF151|nr:hypothetical protein [Chromatium okenii]MBV5307857.1 hypothetical protein [Chromatium okenii]
MSHLSCTTGCGIFLLATTLLTSLTGCQVPFLKPEQLPAFVNKLPLITKPAPTPTTLDAACAARCDAMRPHCEQRQHLRETECEQHFKSTNASHTACVTDHRGHCLQPVACLGADLGLCNTQHQECLDACRHSIPAPANGVLPVREAPTAPEPASSPMQQATAAH